MRLSEADIRRGLELCEKRGGCAGPLTTFDKEHNTSTVGIVCRDNWDDVIRWLAACDKTFPAALSDLATWLPIIAAAKAWHVHQGEGTDSPLAVAIEAALAAEEHGK